MTNEDPTITDCKVCNLLKTDILNEDSINEWLMDSYSDDENTVGVGSLVDLFNNRILSHMLHQKVPGAERVFEIDTLREYITTMSINPNTKISQKTFEMGQTVVEQYDINIRKIAVNFISLYDMKKHLHTCLGLKPDEIDKRTKSIHDLTKSIDFARDVLKNAIERATKRGLLDADYEIVLYAQNMTTSDLISIRDIIPAKNMEENDIHDSED